MFKSLTALMVVAAWVTLGYGIAYSSRDSAAWDDLEAGGRFGMNFSVYLPYLALSVPLAAVAMIAFFPRPDRMWPLAAAMAVIGVVAVWLLGNANLLTVQPDFAIYAFVGIGLDAIAAIPLLVAHELKR